MPNTLPAKTSDDLGTAVTNARAPRANEVSAVNFEKIKDRIIELGTELGLLDGSTPNSVWAALAARISSSRLVLATSPVRVNGGGGADLSADITLSMAAATASNAGHMTAAQAGKVAGNVVGISSGNHQLAPADRVIYCQPTALVQIDILDSDFTGHEHDVLIHLHAGYGGQSIVLNPQGAATIEGAGAAYPLPDCESALAQAWRIYRTGTGDWRVVPLVVTYGTAAGTACEGNDGRLSDARAPTAHAISHAGDGVDAIAEATTSVAGLMSAADKAKLDAVYGYRSVSSDVSIAATDRVIDVDASGGNRTLTLPDPASIPAGCPVIVKKTDAGTNTISLARYATEQIEGVAATYLLPGSSGTSYPAWAFYSTGTNWRVV